MLNDFVALSKLLTGEDALDLTVADRYMQRILEIASNLPDVLTAFKLRVAASADPVRAAKDVLFGDPAFAPTVQNITLIWFTSAILDNKTNKLVFGDDAGQYFSALMWNCIGAHAPGYTNGYFGHWRYPADNLGVSE